NTYSTTDGTTPSASSWIYDPSNKPVLTSDGQVIKYYSTDKAGNTENPHSATAHIDRAGPTTTDDVPSAYVNHNITVTLTASDTSSEERRKSQDTTDRSTPYDLSQNND